MVRFFRIELDQPPSNIEMIAVGMFRIKKMILEHMTRNPLAYVNGRRQHRQRHDHVGAVDGGFARTGSQRDRAARGLHDLARPGASHASARPRAGKP